MGVEEADTERTERVEDDAFDEVRAISPDTTVEYDSDNPVELDLGVFIGNWEVAVSEVYSPPRVVPFCRDNGVRGGSSMDLTTKDEFGRAWDCTRRDMRNHAIRRVCSDKPFILIGSPDCTPRTSIMNVNYSKMSWAKKEDILAAARVHLEFVWKLYQLQHQAGRYFAHEHPQSASSWRERSIAESHNWVGIRCLTIDQCQYGLTSTSANGEELPVRKATTIMTHCPALAVTLNQRRDRSHVHEQLIGGRRTSKAQEYPPGLCQACVEGMALQIEWDNTEKILVATIVRELNNLSAEDAEMAMPPEEEDEPEHKQL